MVGWLGGEAMEGTKVVSLNVNGLNVPAKRRAVFDHLRKSKAHLCLVQETHSTSGTEGIWKSEWGGPAFFAHGTRSSRGVAILVSRDFNLTVINLHTDKEGRFILVDIMIDQTIYTVGCIYAPTQDKRAEQLSFLEKLDELLTETNSTNIILGGDFNCRLHPLLDKNKQGAPSTAPEPVRDKIYTLLEEWSMCDVWRIRNPKEQGYTFRRGAYAARLDYLLISSHLSENATTTSPQAMAHSDHAMISVSWKSDHHTRGPGIWRFDTTLLQNEDFNTQMRDFLTNWVPPQELSNKNAIWEWLKFEIKFFVSSYTRNSHSVEKQHIADLNKELTDLYRRADEEGADISLEAESVRRELREIEESKARKIIFRARSNWTLYGERPSKYFLNLEKRKSKERTLGTIISEEGQILNKPEDILQEGRRFYSRLYKGREDTLTPISEVEEKVARMDFPRLTDLDKESMERPFSEEELRAALNKLNTNKTPGSDGLPPELYTKFWHLYWLRTS